MRQIKLDSEKIDIIYRSVEQASYQLSSIRQGKQLRPMQYTARLCWEALYEAREVLRMTQRSSAEQPRPRSNRPAVSLPSEELSRLAQTIEQVMGKLQQIEMERDLEAMRVLTQHCQKKLESLVTDVLSQRPATMVSEL